MNAVAKRGVNRFSRGTATKPATIMPAMNTSKDCWRRSSNGLAKRQMAHGRQFEIFPPQQIAIKDEESGEPNTGKECQRQHGEVDEEGERANRSPT